MASIYTRARSSKWWAKFRGPGGDTKRLATPFRIDGPVEQAKASAWAARMEELASVYRGSRDLEALEELVREGVEDLIVLEAELTGHKHEAVREPTLRHALRQHHTVQRLVRKAEAGDRRAAADVRRLEKSLEFFAGHVQTDKVSGLTLVRVMAFLDHLRDEKQLAWDTRRHHLLALRRASAGAALLGRTDQLAGKRLDSRDDCLVEETEASPVYTTEQLRQLYHAAAGNVPFQVAIGLMGFAGLRPSELIRLRAGDWDPANKALKVGLRERKNTSSRRDLPLPISLAKLLHQYTRTIPPDDPLISMPHYPGRGKKKAVGVRQLEQHDLPKWWKAQMTSLPAPEEEEDSDGGDAAEVEKLPILAPKSLRKAWVSAAMWDLELPERLIDLYMGHRSPDLSPVTTGHYLSRVTRRLREVAEAFETLMEGG